MYTNSQGELRNRSEGFVLDGFLRRGGNDRAHPRDHPHFPGISYSIVNRTLLVKLQLAKAQSENWMINDEQEAERLRAEKSRLDLQLEVLGKNDPSRHILVRPTRGG